ncbi:MAG: DsrE family protein [Coriobacteriia bacterium]
MNKIKLFLVALGIALSFVAAPAIGAEGPKDKVVLQVSEANPATWNLTMNNVKNFIQALGKDNVSVEVVAYGPGLKMFMLDSPVADRIQEAAEKGVKFAACGNTMKAMKVTKEDLVPASFVVPGGVIELMHKQQEGYAYIKP